MDINLALVNGRIAVPAMIDLDPDGGRVLRMLVLVRSERRRRVDIIPVRMADPPGELSPEELGAGRRVFVAGGLIRRYSPAGPSAGGRMEVAADSISIQPEDGRQDIDQG